jgi:hypothetical protein
MQDPGCHRSALALTRAHADTIESLHITSKASNRHLAEDPLKTATARRLAGAVSSTSPRIIRCTASAVRGYQIPDTRSMAPKRQRDDTGGGGGRGGRGGSGNNKRRYLPQVHVVGNRAACSSSFSSRHHLALQPKHASTVLYVIQHRPAPCAISAERQGPAHPGELQGLPRLLRDRQGTARQPRGNRFAGSGVLLR